MKRSKRILTVAMVVILAAGLFIGTGVTASASELVTTTHTLPTSAYSMLAWEQSGSDYQNTVNVGRNGYMVFDHSEASSTWSFAMQLELRNYQFALDDEYGGLKAKSVKISMKFRVLRDTNLFIDRSGVFEELGSVALYVPGSPATLTDSMYTYVVTPINADSYECELTVFTDNLPTEAFDYHNLSLFFSGNTMLLPYQEDPSSPNVYAAGIVVQPLFGSIDFTYYRTSVGDEISSDLDDVNSNLSDIKDAIVGTDVDDGGAASGLEDIKNSISIDLPDSLPVQDQFDSLADFVGLAGSETSAFFAAFAQPISINIMGYEFDLFTLFFGFLGFLLLFGLVFLILKGSHGTGSNKDD